MKVGDLVRVKEGVHPYRHELGVGIIIDQPICIFVGIAAAVISFVLKEKGIL